MKKRKQDTRDTTAGEEKVIGKDGERNDDHYLLPHAPDKNKQEINRVAGNGRKDDANRSLSTVWLAWKEEKEKEKANQKVIGTVAGHLFLHPPVQR